MPFSVRLTLAACLIAGRMYNGCQWGAPTGIAAQGLHVHHIATLGDQESSRAGLTPGFDSGIALSLPAKCLEGHNWRIRPS